MFFFFVWSDEIVDPFETTILVASCVKLLFYVAYLYLSTYLYSSRTVQVEYVGFFLSTYEVQVLVFILLMKVS